MAILLPMVRYRLHLTTTPPPLPPHPQPQASQSSRWKIPLIILASIVGLVLLIIGIGVLFVLTARDFTPTEDQKDAVVTVDYVAEWFDIEPEERGETWECKRYLDGSKEIFYLYYHEYITLDCTLTIERKRSDTLTSYTMEWQALKLGNRLGDSSINLEEDDTVFQWGDASKFAYQSSDGERNGFAFITRKDNKIFFFDAWGLTFDDPSDVAKFLTPKLEHYEKTAF